MNELNLNANFEVITANLSMGLPRDSGIRDEIQLVDSEFVRHELLHVEGVEVAGEGAGDHWLDLLGLHLGLAYQLESLVSLLVGGLALETQWLVRLELDY